MKRLLWYLIPFVFVVSMFVAPVQAKSNIPSYTDDCTGTCTSFGYWVGVVNGAGTTSTVEDPGFTSGGHHNWVNYLLLYSEDYYPAAVFAGVEKVANSDSGRRFCPSAGAGTYFFIYASDSAQNFYATYCWGAASGDINHDYGMNMLWNGSDLVVNVQGHSSGNHIVDLGSGNSRIGPNWQDITMEHQINDYVTGRHVYGYLFYNNEWHSTSDGNWHNQSRQQDDVVNNGTHPPQYYFYTAARGYTYITCDYDSATFINNNSTCSLNG